MQHEPEARPDETAFFLLLVVSGVVGGVGFWFRENLKTSTSLRRRLRSIKAYSENEIQRLLGLQRELTSARGRLQHEEARNLLALAEVLLPPSEVVGTTEGWARDYCTSLWVESAINLLSRRLASPFPKVAWFVEGLEIDATHRVRPRPILARTFSILRNTEQGFVLHPDGHRYRDNEGQILAVRSKANAG